MDAYVCQEGLFCSRKGEGGGVGGGEEAPTNQAMILIIIIFIIPLRRGFGLVLAQSLVKSGDAAAGGLY